MKKLLTVLILVLTSVFGYSQNNYGDDSCNVYLLHSPFRMFTQMNGRMITTSNCCAAMGPNNLRIMPDSAAGIRVEGSSMEVTDYFWLRFENVCTGEKFRVRSGKENIYLEPSGDQFPYALRQGRAVNVANQTASDWAAWEWDTLVRYGIPDTMLAYAPIMQNTDPYIDSCTGISKGRLDCYHGNPYNLDKVINNAGDTVPLPDGTYWFTNQLYLSNKIVNPGPYPQKATYLATFTGTSFQWENSLPIGNPPSNPTGVQATTTSNKTVNLTWNQTGSVTKWKIQKYASKGPNAGQASGAPIFVTSKPINILPGKGWWKFGITAYDCASPSTEIWSNEVHTTK